MERLGIFLNTAAGSGNKVKRQTAVLQHLKDRFDVVKIIEEANREDAIECLVSEVGEIDTLVSMGGDGTLNAALSGIAASNRPIRIAVVPFGTGNDFAVNLGIPVDPVAALDLLDSGTTCKIDYGKAQWTDDQGTSNGVFANVCGIGFDGFVASAVRPLKQLGVLGYILASTRVLLFWRNIEGTVTSDDSVVPFRRLMFASVMNGRRAGGGFVLAPDAILNDGFLDACIAGPLSKLEMSKLMPLTRFGKKIVSEHVEILRTQTVAITLNDGAPVHLDGEVVSRSAISMQVETIQGGVDVLVPSNNPDSLI